MAYVPSLRKTQAQKTAEDLAAGVNTSGVIDGNTSSGAAPVTPAAAAAVPGSGFINLDNYLKQNVGEGGRMVGATTAGISNEADGFGAGANKIVNDSSAGFTAADGKRAADSVVANIKKGNIKEAARGGGAFLGAGYGGPLAADITAGVESDGAALGGRLAELNDAGTQKAALEATYKGDTAYGAGFSMLDQFLMQGDESGRKKTAEVQAKGAGVTSAVTAATTDAQAKEAAARAALDANKQRALGAATDKQAAMLAAGDRKIITRNKSIDTTREGTAQASYGDVFGAMEQENLAALASMTGTGANPDWSKKSFQAGTVKAPPPPPPPTPEDTAAATAAMANEAAKIVKDVVSKGDPGAEIEQAVKLPDNLNTIPEIIDAPIQAVAGGLAKIGGRWCLAHGTMILMAGGAQRAIQDLVVGDLTAAGGAITSIHEQESAAMYRWAGTLVAEGHAVFDQGTWRRIGDGDERVYGTYRVYPCNTEHHLLVAGDRLFADGIEVPGLGEDECIAALNDTRDESTAALNHIRRTYDTRAT